MRHSLLAMLALIGTACAAPRAYQYVKPPLQLPAAKTDGFTDDELAMEAALKQAAQSPACPQLFGNLIPAAVFVFSDHPGLMLTGTASASGCALERGAKAGVEYIALVDKQNIDALIEILADGAVSDEELYRVHYVTYLGGLAAGFRAEPLYDPRVAQALDLPPVIHFTLLNPNGYQYRGSKEPRRASALLEEGMWRVVEGHQGDAGLKVEVTVAQAAEYARMIHLPDPAKSEAERVKAFKAWLGTVTVR